ncbi:class III lanthionine synthetase LanKC [Actinospica robiniae]|uniref:class III lanthionine synthetase LanKC n=1 Tax=Actinospica robiniae TaxID=304901 RepID=UPI00042A2483|nr:class III lanthionine synthetase LanKC [Actinospica robiniae]
MDMLYEAYSYADALFYDSPVRWGSIEEFAAAGEPLPPGWLRNARDVWVGLQPEEAELPEQGWKIHVSARLENAERVLAIVHAYCLEQRMAFKYLRSPALVHTQNAKYAARGSSGKFLTLYPTDDQLLERCLEDLGAALSGEQGPYILSDLRWGDGPLYLRYGGFTEQYCRSETGELVLALREPSGRLRPDVRRAVFEVPEWAPVPGVLATALAQRASNSVADFPFSIESALHFSNGGGIYLGARTDGDDKRPVVLKEARPHAGLDQRGVDAVTRLGHERDILERLRGVDAVPEVLGYLTAWEHHFLVQEYIEGEPLNLWFGRRFPLIHPDTDEQTVADYRQEALKVLASAEEGLRAIHERGVVFGDLHPRNLIVRPDGRVAFIDFELASPADAFLRPALGAAGFAAPAAVTGFAVDEYAMAALTLWCFVPLLPLTALDPNKVGELAEAARLRFDLPADMIESIRTRLSATSPAARPDHAPRRDPGPRLRALLSGDSADWPALRDSIAAAITASATPEREDRLFPGDPAQFTHDGLGLAYGAAGVLHALHVSGAAVDPEHVEWLVDAVDRERVRPGLFIGSHGVAYALERLGRTEEAVNLLDQLMGRPFDEAGTDLLAGLPGIGLTLLHFSAVLGDRALRDWAENAADRLADALHQPAAASPADAADSDLVAGTGLLRGASGSALLFLRLYETTGDSALLDLAREALDLDLAHCQLGEDGTLQVDEGSRVLPYIETGSAGIGFVLHDYLAHRPDPALRLLEDQIRRAAEPEFIVQSGLFNGRAGLLAYLAHLRGGSNGFDAVIRRHIRSLAWHLVPYQGHAAFPGDQLLRLSMDVATGSAGVLLGLGSVLADVTALPFTASARVTAGVAADAAPALDG